MAPSPEIPQPRQVPPTKEKNEALPQRYAIEHIAEAPLIERKIYVAKRTAVYPTNDALQQQRTDFAQGNRKGIEEYGGKTFYDVPAVLRVIAEDKKNGTVHVANSNGESVGWLEVENQRAHEWSTNHIVRISPTRDRPKLFASKEQALQGSGSTLMPDYLWDEKNAFPLLEADTENGLYKIGHPLPRTLNADVEFPIWVSSEDLNAGLLVDKVLAEQMANSLLFVRDQWTKLKDVPDFREEEKRIQQLLNAHQVGILALISGNNVNQGDLLQKTLGYLSQKGFLEPDVHRMSIDDFDIMLDSTFADFIDSMTANIERLQKSVQNDQTYSVFDGKKNQKRICISNYNVP